MRIPVSSLRERLCDQVPVSCARKNCRRWIFRGAGTHSLCLALCGLFSRHQDSNQREGWISSYPCTKRRVIGAKLHCHHTLLWFSSQSIPDYKTINSHSPIEDCLCWQSAPILSAARVSVISAKEGCFEWSVTRLWTFGSAPSRNIFGYALRVQKQWLCLWIKKPQSE